MDSTRTFDAATELLLAQGYDSGLVRAVFGALRNAGLDLADGNRDEFVVRWVNVNERAVPPDADTIIRTITQSSADGRQSSTTHWLDGLRGPRI